VAEVLVSIFSETQLNAYGNIRGVGGVVLRFLPEFCLLTFYSYFFFSLIRSGRVRRMAVLIHSGIFVVIGLGLAIPFMGVILSNLTPVALVYTSIMFLADTSSGYWGVVVLAIVFSSINLWIMIVELQKHRYPLMCCN